MVTSVKQAQSVANGGATKTNCEETFWRVLWVVVVGGDSVGWPIHLSMHYGEL